MADLLTVAAAPRERLLEQLKISGGGALAGSLVVPVTLAQWAPTSFAVSWAAVFAAQTILYLGLVSWTGSGWIWSAWEGTAGLMLGAVGVSVLVWGADNPSASWIAGGLLLAYISFELASVPYLPVPIWFAGSLFAGVPLLVMMFVANGPLVGAGFTLALAVMAYVASENRNLRLDLTASLEMTNEELLADPLTGLLNRRGLQQRLGELHGQSVTLAVFDADRFKHINDTQGHGVGDQALIALARNLVETLEDGWTVSRYGGDEFIAFAAGEQRVESNAVEPVAVELDGRDGSITVSLSAGVASGTLEDDGDRLKSEAGHALRHAKRDGTKLVHSVGALRNRFERSLDITSIDRTQIPVVPVVQPIVGDAGIVGAEIQARWQLEDGTLLEPAMFMDMLVENGLLGQLDEVMLDQAVRLAARFEGEGYDLVVSANIAASQLVGSEISTRVEQFLNLHNVEPARLRLKVTESNRLGEQRVWESSVRRLSELGIGLAISAESSSVVRLSHLPFTTLKLDRMLVREVAGPMGGIVKGVAQFCESVDVDVIAEGVETLEEVQALRAVGVTTLQGYLIGRPMRLEEFVRHLDDRTEKHGPTVGQEIPQASTHALSLGSRFG